MVIGAPRLCQVEPRERVGAQTGRKYEYQYERTARATLDLLVDGLEYVCVYCDWHDDYVIEIGVPPTRYVFHQVKARTSSQGPWTFSDFFGLRMKKGERVTAGASKVRIDAIVPVMLLHHKNFGANCGGLAFVTNAGIDPALYGFLTSVSQAKAQADLPKDAQIPFEHMARAYTSADPQLAPSSADLFAWIRGLNVCTDQGKLEDVDAALRELADIVVEFSEIELLQRQAKQIAREIVNRVRVKVAHSTTVVPTSDEQLRRDKGIVVAELLRVLSLSADAYEQLKAGAGQDVVKTLSRLQRFCIKHGMQDSIVPICEFKAKWDIWRTIERHFLSSADYLLLQSKAHEVLKAGLTIDRMVVEAKDIAKQFASVTAVPLTPEHVIGLIFSLAAQGEAVNTGQV